MMNLMIKKKKVVEYRWETFQMENNMKIEAEVNTYEVIFNFSKILENMLTQIYIEILHFNNFNYG